MRRFAVSPGRRAHDLNDPTTALHQKYHDGTIQYTMENFEWVEKKGYSACALEPEERSQVQAAARERLFRWPRLEAQDLRRVSFGSSAQHFCEREEAAALGDPLDNIFVVNMKRRPEKLRRVMEQLETVGLNANIVTAVDGDAVCCQEDLTTLGVSTLPNYVGHRNHDMPFTTGEVGCFLSHYTIWHHMVERGVSSALILEDDFDLQDNFAERLGGYLHEAAGTSWNIMYVGRSPMENDVRSVSEHVVECGYTLWTVAYILRLDAARALLDIRAEKHMAPLDDFFSVAMGCGMDCTFNDKTLEWSKHLPPILKGLGMNPPLVMPYVGSMFLSDTAMLRKGTRYVKDLPVTLSEATAGAQLAPTATPPPFPGMQPAWLDALRRLAAFQAAASEDASSPAALAALAAPAGPAGAPGAAAAAAQEWRDSASLAPDAGALSASYQLAGTWGWGSFVDLQRRSAQSPWFDAEVAVPLGGQQVEFQVLRDGSFDQRYFPAPAGDGAAIGPGVGGHGLNWKVVVPAQPASKLQVSWNPVLRTLTCTVGSET